MGTNSETDRCGRLDVNFHGSPLWTSKFGGAGHVRPLLDRRFQPKTHTLWRMAPTMQTPGPSNEEPGPLKGPKTIGSLRAKENHTKTHKLFCSYNARLGIRARFRWKVLQKRTTELVLDSPFDPPPAKSDWLAWRQNKVNMSYGQNCINMADWDMVG